MMLEEATFDADKGAIHYWRTVDADASLPWLVFLPGLTSDHSLFGKQAGVFDGRANSLMWDAPSHGLSRPFPLDWTLDDLARYLHDILEAEGIEQPILVGHSMGGYVAQAYMDLYPGSVRGFIAIDSAPLGRIHYRRWELFVMRHMMVLYRMLPALRLRRWVARDAAITADGRNNMMSMMDAYTKREFSDVSAHGYRMRAEAVEQNRAYAIDCPAILLCGTNDMVSMNRRYNKLWTRESGVSLIFISKAGHNSPQDNPEAINRSISAFLSILGFSWLPR